MQNTVYYNVTVTKKLCDDEVEQRQQLHEGLRILARIIASYHTLHCANHTTMTSEVEVKGQTLRRNIAANAGYDAEDRPRH